MPAGARDAKIPTAVGHGTFPRVLFNSFHFAAFFVVVLGVAWALRSRVRPRNLFLLIASYYFYGCWDWRFLGLIVVSTVVDFLCGLALDVRTVDEGKAPPPSRRRALILVISLVTNLGILGFFKYYDFFVTSAVEALARAGIETNVRTLAIILPVGISFYTFQTLSYTIDVYRGKLATEHNLLNFALFVAFFPQLVAGPIERASHLLPQIERPTTITSWHLHTGFHLIGWGLFKKVVIADNVALVVDAAFGAYADGMPRTPAGLSAVLGVYAFAIQIYCDFSGYTDIARGVGRCMGFDLMINFNLPYFAVNPSDFWHRWHISLSTWLRDYLYIPLGGSRKGPVRTYVNLMITMLLGGLWHGAAWTFVLWGLFHGLLLAAHRRARPLFERWGDFRSAIARAAWHVVCVIVFFQITCAGWLLFRAESLAQLHRMTVAIVTAPLTYDHRMLGDNGAVTVIASALVLLAVQLAQALRNDRMVLFHLPLLPRTVLYALLLLGFVVFGEFGETPFIYFQF